MKRSQRPSNSPSRETRFAAITLGVDGRIYCHDLTPELVNVLATLCRTEPALATRLCAARELGAVKPTEDACHE